MGRRIRRFADSGATHRRPREHDAPGRQPARASAQSFEHFEDHQPAHAVRDQMQRLGPNSTEERGQRRRVLIDACRDRAIREGAAIHAQRPRQTTPQQEGLPTPEPQAVYIDDDCAHASDP